MKAAKPLRRLTAGVYGISRGVVRLVSGAVLLILAGLLVLRFHGVPGPLLREAVRRINAAGHPVAVERVYLTWRGWRAESVRYYSNHPDDLLPVVEASRIYVDIHRTSAGAGSRVWSVDVEAIGAVLSPPGLWGVELPPESALRQIPSLRLSLRIGSGRIEVSEASLFWCGCRFNATGAIRRIDEAVWARPYPARPRPAEAYVSESQAREWERRLEMLSFEKEPRIDLVFEIDAADPVASRIEFVAEAGIFAVRGVGFDGAGCSGSYAFPKIALQRAELRKDGRMAGLECDFDFMTGLVAGSLSSAIDSAELLALLPGSVQALLDDAGIRFGSLPLVEAAWDAVRPRDLLNGIEGSFHVRDVSYADLQVETLGGSFSRKAGRLELSGIEGRVRGQEERAEEMGSGMRGGAASGSAFWDEPGNAFGVEASVDFDPTLLLGALASVDEATDVMARFAFGGQAPSLRVALGSRLDDWDTFFIDVQGRAVDVSFHGVGFSSIDAVASYTNGILRLDPLAASQGAHALAGSASIDFRRSIAFFDARSTLPPAALEQAIHPGLDLFRDKIKTAGMVRIDGQGSVDWESMRETRFSADIEVERIELVPAVLDGLVATVSGQGAGLRIDGAAFGIYGGRGGGQMTLLLDPATNAMPYTLQVNLAGADFQEAILHLGSRSSASGKLSGTIDLSADLARDFPLGADGRGSVAIKQGQLTDLPLFQTFSAVMRWIFPSFNVFSITSIQGTFGLEDGVVRTEDAYFGGDIISARGRGSYSESAGGFDALIQVQILGDSTLSKVVQAITDPFLKLIELRLTGRLDSPSWRLERLPSDVQGLLFWKKE